MVFFSKAPCICEILLVTFLFFLSAEKHIKIKKKFCQIMKTLAYFACLLAAISLVACESVPVLLWGVSKESISVPALHQLAENEFSSIIAAKLKAETFTVVFQERKVRIIAGFNFPISIFQSTLKKKKKKIISHMINFLSYIS
jgi:hypothetical protein